MHFLNKLLIGNDACPGNLINVELTQFPFTGKRIPVADLPASKLLYSHPGGGITIAESEPAEIPPWIIPYPHRRAVKCRFLQRRKV